MSKSFEKLREFARSPLSPAPGSHHLQIDSALPGDPDCGAQALAIVPVIEGRQAITARIGRGERSYPDSSNPVDNRSNVYVGADAKGAGRKLDKKDSPRMFVVVAGSTEADGFHDCIKLPVCDSRLQDEIKVRGLVLTTAVQRRTRSTREDRPDVRTSQSPRDTSGDLCQTGTRGEAQSRFPARRGRFLSSALRATRSVSAPARRLR